MHISGRVQQIAAKIQAASGVAEALAAADVKFRTFDDVVDEPQHPRFTNEEVGDDLAPPPDFVGGSQGQISVGFNLHSSGVLAGPHAIGAYLRACGMKEQVIQSITVGAITGGDTIFKAGETYSAAAGAKTGIIDEDLSGPGVLKYIVTGGTGNLAAADVVTANGDSATASGSNTTIAVKYSPRSTGQEELTIARLQKNSAGDANLDSLYRLKGALGTFSLAAAALDVFKSRFVFTGVEDAQNTTSSLFTGVGYELGTDSQLPKLQNAVLQINGQLVKPVSFDFACNNQVEMDPDVTTDGGLNGYKAARIGGREATINIDPLRVLNSVIDMKGFLKSGDRFPFLLRAGVSPWQIELVVKKAQIRQVQSGQRAGLATSGLTIVATRGDLPDDDFALYFK